MSAIIKTKITNKTFKKVDLYSLVTNEIIEELEKGILPWVCPWDCTQSQLMPINASTGAEYQGINILMLWRAMNKKRFASNKWITYRQAEKIGANVRRGERGTMIFFSKPVYEKEKNAKGEYDLSYVAIKNYSVFNFDQVENIDDVKLAKIQSKTNSDIDTFLKSTGADIISNDGIKAFFRPSTEQIVVPHMSRFENNEDFHATVFHELIHWTGSKKRLDRNMSSDKKSYAFEELIAEMGSVMLKATFEVNGSYSNHASYISGWLEALKNDKKFIFQAASKASIAHRYLLDFSKS